MTTQHVAEAEPMPNKKRRETVSPETGVRRYGWAFQNWELPDRVKEAAKKAGFRSASAWVEKLLTDAVNRVLGKPDGEGRK